MSKQMTHGCKNYKSNIKGMGSFILLFKNSSNIETAGYFGISHLIEHCMCEELKKYELDFERYGINYNAATNFTYVKFYINGLDEGIVKFRKIFYDLIVNYQITKDVFERERNIVIQEFNDLLNKREQLFVENVIRKYFNMRSSIGEFEDLENLTYEKFIEYKNKYFSYPTYICNTSSSKIKRGEFKTQKVNLNISDLTGLPFNESIGIPLLTSPLNEENKSINIGYVSKFTYNTDTLEEYLYYSLITNYLCYGLSSPLYKELRENTGHVYMVSSFVDSILKAGNGCFWVFVKTDPQYEDEIKEKLLECLNKYLNNIDKNTYDNIILGVQNSLKRQKLTSFSNSISFYSKYIEICEKYTFDFEKFKSYSKKLLNTNYILVNDITY